MKSVILFRQIGVVIMLAPRTSFHCGNASDANDETGKRLKANILFLAFLQLVANGIRSTFGYELHRLSRFF